MHQQFLHIYIYKVVLNASKQLYKDREIYFISEEDLKLFKEESEFIKRGTKKSFDFSDKNLYLFQSLVNEENNELARIIELDDGGKILTEEGRSFQLADISKERFKRPPTLVGGRLSEYINKILMEMIEE